MEILSAMFSALLLPSIAVIALVAGIGLIIRRRKPWHLWGGIGLLILFGLIGLLYYSMVTASTSTPRARDYERKQILEYHQKATDIYFEQNGSFPNTLEESPYYAPHDRYTFSYQVLEGGKDFRICTRLEDKSETCLNSKLQF